VKRSLLVLLSLLWWAASPVRAQESEQAPDPPAASANASTAERVPNTSGFEVLSKATPAELSNYPFRVLAGVRNHWFPLIRELRNSPEWKPGEAVIEFEIRRDGSLGAVKKMESAGSDDLDAAAEQAITSAAPFRALPDTYRGNNLKMRFHFGYDRVAAPEAPLCQGPNWGAHTAVLVMRKKENGVTPPRPTYSPDPEYSEAARRKKYQSRARLAGTVDLDGNFTDLCVLVPAGLGLDEKATSAVRTWRFEPATVDGTPTAVRITLEVDFRLY
jgi:TonB family protein